MKKLLVLLCIALVATAWAQAPTKYALVIGNGGYKNIKELDNPVNDANDMAVALVGLGFTVDKVIDGSLNRMEQAVTTLKNRLSASRNSYGFLFYAGHGVQAAGESFLIPVDSDIQSENYLRQRAVSVQTVLDEINSAGNELNIVVLDACRDNPFRWASGRGGYRGLSVIASPPADSIIVYSTGAGQIAADGTGRNSPFTGSFLTHLKTPGLEITEVIRRTGAAVSEASGRKQIPAVYNQFFGTAYLAGLPVAPVPVQPASRPAPANRPTMQAAPAVQPAAHIERPISGGFVLVEGGTFQMGSNSGYSDQKPVHSVTVKSFNMGKYEVTQKEWVEVMGNNPSNFKGDNRPVENVSWNDAVEYCNRRSEKKGLTPAYTVSGNTVTWNRNANGYRLPTEAEWEFAAKGGIKGGAEYRYSGSNNADVVVWYASNSGSRTHDVGTKAPNSLGIYDMSGNVCEWCWDWYGAYKSGAQTDPAGASSGAHRVYRGGAWDGAADFARSVNRSGNIPSARTYRAGFRLVRP